MMQSSKNQLFLFLFTVCMRVQNFYFSYGRMKYVPMPNNTSFVVYFQRKATNYDRNKITTGSGVSPFRIHTHTLRQQYFCNKLSMPTASYEIIAINDESIFDFTFFILIQCVLRCYVGMLCCSGLTRRICERNEPVSFYKISNSGTAVCVKIHTHTHTCSSHMCTNYRCINKFRMFRSTGVG